MATKSPLQRGVFAVTQSDHSFSPDVVDHFLHPRNVGSVENATATVELVNEICGDNLQMSVKISAGKIEAIKFRSEGCAVAVASASKLTEAVTGRTIAEADNLAKSAVASVQQGTHSEKQHCLDIVLLAWQKLLAEINTK